MDGSEGQCGLDLGEDDATDRGEGFKLEAPGTWKGSKDRDGVSVSKELAMKARAGLSGVPEQLKRMIEPRIDWAEMEIERVARLFPDEPDTAVFPWCIGHEIDMEAFEWLKDSLAELEKQIEGARSRVRPGRLWRKDCVEVLFYVPGVGTLDATNEIGRAIARFEPYESQELSEQWYDKTEKVRMLERLWKTTMCLDSLSDTSTDAPSVRTVTLGHRLLVVCSATYSEDSTGHAWSLVPRSQWVGQTVTKKRLYEAWDAGECRRGDMRGMQVSVRGRLYVMATPIDLVDDRSREERNAELWLENRASRLTREVDAEASGELLGDEEGDEGDDGDADGFGGNVEMSAMAAEKKREEGQYEMF